MWPTTIHPDLSFLNRLDGQLPLDTKQTVFLSTLLSAPAQPMIKIESRLYQQPTLHLDQYRAFDYAMSCMAAPCPVHNSLLRLRSSCPHIQKKAKDSKNNPPFCLLVMRRKILRPSSSRPLDCLYQLLSLPRIEACQTQNPCRPLLGIIQLA
jgi:hypothetical protein